MIVNSCNYPGSCACVDCEDRKLKENKRFNFIKRKREPLLHKEKRLKLIGNYYKDSTEEYRERNIPTNLYELFYGFLSAVPKDHLVDCNTLGLFKDILEDIIGKEEVSKWESKKRNLIKKYI